jgi:Tfp pilus assembly protein PilX
MILKKQRGYVMVFTLFVLLLFTVIGSSIYSLTANEITFTNNSLTKMQRFSAAESCIDKSIQWLKINHSNSEVCKKIISGTDLEFGIINSKNYSGDSHESISYECQIECFNESSRNGIGLGTQIDMDMGYGRPRQVESGSLGAGSYYYKIKSHGKSYDNKISTIEALISVNY